MKMNIIIFTDLDGTLLDHEDYSFEGAIPALKEIKRRNVPLIMTTSKTRKEVEILQRKLGVEDPFIVESGAAIFFKKGYRDFRIENGTIIDDYIAVILGETYEKIREVFEIYKEEYCLRGFKDMTAEEVSSFTNLPIERAKLAMEREFTEPFITDCPDKMEDLRKEVERHGLKITRGGRFYHLIGKHQDKGRAVDITKKIFEENCGRKITTVGLGDSENDFPMLQKVDIPVLIRKHDGGYENVNLPNLRRSTHPGSRGWNEVVLSILYQLEIRPTLE